MSHASSRRCCQDHDYARENLHSHYGHQNNISEDIIDSYRSRGEGKRGSHQQEQLHIGLLTYAGTDKDVDKVPIAASLMKRSSFIESIVYSYHVHMRHDSNYGNGGYRANSVDLQQPSCGGNRAKPGMNTQSSAKTGPAH